MQIYYDDKSGYINFYKFSILIYDIQIPKTYEQIDMWLEQLREKRWFHNHIEKRFIDICYEYIQKQI